MITLRKGRRGPEVERWQRFLIAQKLLNDVADGAFGDKTDAATRTFQELHELEPDGLVGADTIGRAQELGFTATRRVRPKELTRKLIEHAERILSGHARDPFGTEIPFEEAGKRYLGRIEEHYHEPGGPLKPWGYHPGVSLLVFVTLSPEEPVHDDS